MYRNADYDYEWDRQSTASYQEGLNPDHELDIRLPIRRTNSAGDASRFHRYFNLLQKHLNGRLTWKRYAGILHDGLRDYQTPVYAPWKNKLKTRRRSELSVYMTASESPSADPEQNRVRFGQPSSCSVTTVDEFPGDIGTPRSWNANLHIKKIRKETKAFAHGIFKSLDVLYKIQKKKGDTPKKHFVRTIDRVRDSPISSPYGSSISVDLSTGGSTNSSVASGAGDSSIARRRFRKNLVEAIYAN